MNNNNNNQVDPRGTSFPITDPNIVRNLDSLSPEQMEKLNQFLEEGMKELREKRGVKK